MTLADGGYRVSTRTLACSECGGEGRIWASRYGGNDPDVWDAGPCEACAGTGDQACEVCNDGSPAVAEWRLKSRPWSICRSCHDEWLAAEGV